MMPAHCVRLVIVFLLLAGAGLPIAFGARLPGWAQEVAESAPALEDVIPHHQTRVLLSETHMEVEKDGRFVTRWRFASQALSAHVSRIETQNFHFREGARILASKAWHLPLDEKARRSYLPPMDLTIDSSFLTDAKARFISVNGVGRGSIVFFECSIAEMPFALGGAHLFFEGAPTVLSRFELEVPSTHWSVKSAWLHKDGPPPVMEGALARWEMRDLPPDESEAMGEPAANMAPLLVFTIIPPPKAEVEPVILRDWLSLAKWYEGLSQDRDFVTPEISSAVRKAVPADSRSLGAIVSLARLVRDTVRYVDNEVGLGSYRPRPAGDVLAQLQGDCKDKSTLLKSLLRSAGHVSYPVLISLGESGSVSDEVPHLGAFNHLILAAPLPSGAAAPAFLEPAIIRTEDFGSLLVIDVTDTYNAIGSISPDIAGRKGLLIAGDRSRLLSIPAAAPATHRIDRMYRTRIEPDGSIGVTLTARYLGEPATNARGDYRTSSTERRKRVNVAFLDVFAYGEQVSYTAEPETPDGTFVETSTWKIPASAPTLDVPLFIGAENALTRTSVTQRKTPFRYAYPISLSWETQVDGAPASAVLPKSEDRTGRSWTIRSTIGREAATVHGRWDLVLSTPRFDTADMKDLKALWSAMGATGKVALRMTEEKAEPH